MLVFCVVFEGRLGTSVVFLATEAITRASDAACNVTPLEFCDVIFCRGGGGADIAVEEDEIITDSVSDQFVVGNESDAEFA